MNHKSTDPSMAQFERGRIEWDPFEVSPSQRAAREAVVRDLSRFDHLYHHVLFGSDEVDDYDRRSEGKQLLSPQELAILRRFRANNAEDLAACAAELNQLPEGATEWTAEQVATAMVAVAASVRREVQLHQANCISSRLAGQDEERTDMMHTVIVDIDHPVRVVESSTPGHYHLYIDVPIPWSQYEPLLAALANAGVMEEGYYRAAVRREATHLRLPWVAKEPAVGLQATKNAA